MTNSNEAREALAEVRGIRKAADHLRLMQNGGGSGKGLVWGLLDWADEMEKKTSAALAMDLREQGFRRPEPVPDTYEWEYAYMADAYSANHYATREEAEEYMGNPQLFRRRKPGPWEPVEGDS
jgi:hypothetical protein|tara:strand:+ start:35497 stop:35865 length:369 start_codon:yes stop_codon:yes gene_type:complete